MSKWLLLEIQNPLESNIKNSAVADEHEVWETVLLEKICIAVPGLTLQWSHASFS